MLANPANSCEREIIRCDAEQRGKGRDIGDEIF
jgi:hypothetical protein